jgi:hypothetical protein
VYVKNRFVVAVAVAVADLDNATRRRMIGVAVEFANKTTLCPACRSIDAVAVVADDKTRDILLFAVAVALDATDINLDSERDVVAEAVDTATFTSLAVRTIAAVTVAVAARVLYSIPASSCGVTVAVPVEPA